jgi:25S rRNA (cytosine2870-C5)-methyltransferase
VGDQGITKHRMKRFHPSVKHCKRVYPHTHNMDGFFVAKLVKYANGIKSMEAELQAKEDEVTRAAERKVNKAKNAKKRSKKEKRKAKAEEIKNNPERKKAKEDKKKAFIAKK